MPFFSNVRKVSPLLATLVGVFVLAGSASAETSLLEVNKRVNTSRAQVGEVVAFQVDAVNTSETSYLSSDPSGGILFSDWPPSGFKLVEGSARITTSAGLDLPAQISRQGDHLIFGRTSPQGPVGVSLRAGQRVQLRYKMMIEAGVQPGRTFQNKASVRTGSGLSLSSIVLAEVRVEADPEFDLGLVLGHVFCDSNGDGAPGPDERGLGGVRIYADHGWYADTDADGRFHIQSLQAGNHLFKVDPNSLPPGATATTPLRQLLYVTPGLLAHLRIGVACRFERVQAQALKTAKELAQTRQRENAALSTVLTVTGDIHRTALRVNARQVKGLSATLRLEAPLGRAEPVYKSGVRNVPWNLGGVTDPLVFRMRTKGPASKEGHWRLQVVHEGQEGQVPVREFHGQGLPPKKISWKGESEDGKRGLLERGGLYRARLWVFDGAGSSAVAPSVTFGVSYGAKRELLSDKIFRGRLFLKGSSVGYVLKRVLKRLRRDLDRFPDLRLAFEVHSDASNDPSSDLLNTQLAASKLKAEIFKTLELRGGQVQVRALGSTRPLRSEESAKDRAFNRRVSLRVYPGEDEDSFKEPKALTSRSQVTIQGLVTAVKKKGGFMRLIKRPKSNLLHVKVERTDGSIQTSLVPLEALLKPRPQAKKKASKELGEIDPLRRVGGAVLREALGSEKVMVADPTAVKSTASRLWAHLPPKGQPIGTTRLYVAGATDAANTLQINGVTLHVAKDGRFSRSVALPVGKSDLVIESLDPTGRRARITWPVEVASQEYFLLALADGVAGQVDSQLMERSHYDEVKLGDFFLGGRTALYFKGRISGTKLFKNVLVTAHLDSTKDEQFSAFYEQVIAPHQNYAIFGDTSQEVQDVTSRGKFYVLVEADKSRLKYGSIRTDFEGVELLRYNRTLVGGKLDFQHAFAQGADTRVQAFVSDDVQRLSRGHDEMRATGGSLYYLSKGEVIDGSEQVSVVVRDMVSGMELARTTLVRDQDYRITGFDGRLMLNSPLPSTMDAMSSIGGMQPFAGTSMLRGHAVWVVVDYESRSLDSGSKLAWGAHGTQKIMDVLELGGGYLQEGRTSGDDYRMLGAHLKLDLGKKAQAYVEFAESAFSDGVSHVSQDGGVHYQPLSRAGGDAHGYAFKAGIDSHVGALLEMALDLRLKGYYQRFDSGFHAVGTALEQGMEKMGGEASYRPTLKDTVQLRMDMAAVRIPDTAFTGDFRMTKRLRIQGRYQHREGLWDVSAETLFGQHRDDADGAVEDTGGVAIGGGYRLNERLKLLAIQEGIFLGDPDLAGDTLSDRMLTHLGADWKLTDDFGLRAMSLLRWNGDHGLRLGLRNNLSADTNLFLEERVMRTPGSDDLMYSTVFGARRSLGQGGQMFGEYRLDSGVSGPANRAVMGLGQRFTLSEGVHIIAAYERTQTFGGFEGRGSRDVLSTGLNVTAFDSLKYGGRYEVRLDQGMASGDGADRVQVLMRNNLNLKLSPDLTATLLSTYTMTEDLSLRHMDQEALEVTAGVAYRPLSSDFLTMLSRFTHRLTGGTRLTLSPLGLAGEADWTQTTNLGSVAVILELPHGLQLSEKLVYKHRLSVEGLDAETTHQLLSINRFAVHLLERTLDMAVEYRLMWGLPSAELLHGALAEVAYTLYGHARLGLGYNFARFSADVMDDLSENKSGFYVRLTGVY